METSEKEKEQLEKFKQILEYFVLQLSKSFEGEEKYKSAVASEILEGCVSVSYGTGYTGDNIQKKMEQEALGEDSSNAFGEDEQRICITILSSAMGHSAYLHLVKSEETINKSAATNINPVYNEDSNEKLFVGLEVGPVQSPNPTYVFPKLKHTFDDLGLFKDEPTEEQQYNLKTFFEYFLKMREQELMGGLTYKGREQLLTTHNMILTGAPGTGKTWSAKNIAAWIINGKSYLELDGNEKSEFKKRCELVQFHPSYDYTDFVEGLRPISNEDSSGSDRSKDIGFELKEGVFKKFCEKALEDRNACYDGIDNLIKGKCIKEDKIDKLVDAIQKEDKGFKLGETNDELLKTENSEEECSKNARKFVEKATKKLAPKYVFIIDEINRGELSKIFGELFFSIDPGYRGPDGAVLTQYANMVKTQNVFDKKIDPSDTNKEYGHFFVPENVYIIGTMNDIDRSVESMDFAMRRRFSFIEVKANERMDMWKEDWRDIAAACMKAVNKKIEGIPGLSSAYHIGPAYFKKLNNYKSDFFKLWDNHLYGVIFEYLRGKKKASDTINEIQDEYLKALVEALKKRFNQGEKWGAKLLKNWENAKKIDCAIQIDEKNEKQSKDNISNYLTTLKDSINCVISKDNRADEIFKLSNAIKYLMDIGDKIENLS